jgi:hypothetical protein
MSQRFVLAAAAAAASFWATDSLAVDVSPALSAFTLRGTTVRDEPSLDGIPVVDVFSSFRYWGSLDISGCDCHHEGYTWGTVESKVLRKQDGTLDFYWRITNDAGSLLPVEALRITGFPVDHYGANWRSDNGGSAALAALTYDKSGLITYFAAYNLSPSEAIGEGETGYELFLSTDAHAFASSGSLTLLSSPSGPGSGTFFGTSAPMPTFVPVAAVPEISSLQAFLLGAAGLLAGPLARRRQHRRG